MCLIDEAGKTLWSSKVVNDEGAILEAIGEVLTRAQQVVWAVDVTGTMSALLLALLAAHGQQVTYVPGPTVNRLTGAYQREAKTDDNDARVDDVLRVVDAASFGLVGRVLPAGRNDGASAVRRYVDLVPYAASLAVGVGRQPRAVEGTAQPWAWVRVRVAHAAPYARVIQAALTTLPAGRTSGDGGGLGSWSACPGCSSAADPCPPPDQDLLSEQQIPRVAVTARADRTDDRDHRACQLRIGSDRSHARGERLTCPSAAHCVTFVSRSAEDPGV